MLGFLQFLGAVIGVLGVISALGALVIPGLGLPMAVGIGISSLSLAGLLAGIAGIALRIEDQTRVNRAIFNAIDELWLKPREGELRAEGDTEAAKRALDTRQTGTPYGTRAKPAEPARNEAVSAGSTEAEAPELVEARATLAKLRVAREGRYPTAEEEQAQAEVARLEFEQEGKEKPFGWNT